MWSWYVKLAFSLVSLRDLFFPRKCIVCGESLSPDESHFCFECFRKMPLTYFWQWRDNPAREKLAERIELEDAAALFFYRPSSGFRMLTQAVKYRGDRLLGYRLGFMLGRFMSQKEWFSSIDAVTPVPLHPLRRYRRGYNQARIIAQGIADALGVPLVCGLVIRRRYTRTQTRLDTAAKEKNVKGAFAVRKGKAKKILGRGVGNILLVDDVLTTGATLSQCAAALGKHFRVSVASLGFVG